MKKLAVVVIACLLLFSALPGMAVLKVLEPELSAELRGIAVEHIVRMYNVERDAVAVEYSWVRELWNLKVDVYMVEAVINKGLASEQKAEIPVRVDQKAVISAEELKALEEEDTRLAPDEPQFRTMAVPEQEAAPATPDASRDGGFGDARSAGYLIASLALLLMAGIALLARRRRT